MMKHTLFGGGQAWSTIFCGRK